MPRKSSKSRGAAAAQGPGGPTPTPKTPVKAAASNPNPAAELLHAVAEGPTVPDAGTFAAAEALERLHLSAASDGDPPPPEPEAAPPPPQPPMEASSSGRAAVGRSWEEEAATKLLELAGVGGEEVELTEEEVHANDQSQEDEVTRSSLLSMATKLTKAMKGSLCHDFETGIPAADVWEVYGGLLAGQLVPQLLPVVFSKVELVEGDGGVGTVLLVTLPPGTPASETFKEKFIKIDNENYIKEAIVTEGGFLDHGFQKYLVRIEIIGKEDTSSIIRSTIEYEVDDEHTSNPPVVSTSGLATIAEAITKYIKEQKRVEQSPKQISEEQSVQLKIV